MCQILWNSIIAFSRYWKTKTSQMDKRTDVWMDEQRENSIPPNEHSLRGYRTIYPYLWICDVLRVTGIFFTTYCKIIRIFYQKVAKIYIIRCIFVLAFEKSHKKRDLSIMWFETLQMCMHSHSIGSAGMWLFVWSFLSYILCERTTKALARPCRMNTLTWAFAVCLYD